MKKCIFQLPAPDAKLLFEKRRRGGGVKGMSCSRAIFPLHFANLLSVHLPKKVFPFHARDPKLSSPFFLPQFCFGCDGGRSIWFG